MEHLKIRDEAALVAALASDRFLLFKHSFKCPISARAFKEYEEFLERHPVASGWIDVVVQRPLSLKVDILNRPH